MGCGLAVQWVSKTGYTAEFENDLSYQQWYVFVKPIHKMFFLSNTPDRRSVGDELQETLLPKRNQNYVLICRGQKGFLLLKVNLQQLP